MNWPRNPSKNGSLGPELTSTCGPNELPRSVEVASEVLYRLLPGVSSRCRKATCTRPLSGDDVIHGKKWSAVERSLFTINEGSQVRPPSTERLKRTSALPRRCAHQTTYRFPLVQAALDGDVMPRWVVVLRGQGLSELSF